MRIRTVQADGMPSIASAVIDRWFTPGFRQSSAIPESMCEILCASSAAGYASACAAVRDMNFTDSISAIQLPTLVIGGLRDPATPPPHSEFLASSIQDAQLRWLDAAHLSNLEHPVEFARLVSEFFARNNH